MPPIIYAILPIIFWGTSFLSTKILLQNNFSPMMISFIRFFLVSAILLFVKDKDRTRIKKSDYKYFFLMGFFGVTLFYYFENSGLKYTTIANTSLITATIPLFTLIYAYICSYFFFSAEVVSIFLKLAFGVTTIWLSASLFLFFKNKNNLAIEREKEKFYDFAKRIKNEFGLDENSNIFEKIELIKSFINSNFSKRGLFANRVFELANNSLKLYMENLKIIKELKDVEKLTKDDPKEKQFYQEEIKKNLEQNEIIVKKLDEFIKEIMSDKNNDKEINKVSKEFEQSLEIFNTIKSRR